MSTTQDAGGMMDGGDMDAGGCAYIDIAPFVVSCPEVGFTEGTHWVNTAGSSPECPDYYTLNDSRGASESEAIAAASCSPSCVYHATRSVDLRYCGRRIGYERYDATRPRTCPSIIAVGGGYYGDFSEYTASHPCPDAGADLDASAVGDGG